MQNTTNQVSQLFTQGTLEKAKNKVIDYKKPILIGVITLLTVFVGFQVYSFLQPKEKTAMEILVEKQTNNIEVIGNELEKQAEYRKQITKWTWLLATSTWTVADAETSNSQIRDQMLQLANPLSDNQTGSNEK